ncbi:hypothetical protein VTP01DRAFT_2430 [Rhizomucor pusillus]|uniref:uncharacterized protein n=1 Tax=Rhizomucor pusillus TaxID=4840 RepID=UPI0037422FBF
MESEENVKDLQVSQYELKRQAMIQENQKLLRELGLARGDDGVFALVADLPAPPPPKKKARHAYKRPTAEVPAGPTRMSRRLKGEAPDDTVDLESILDQNDKMRQVALEKVHSAAPKDAIEKRYAPDSISVPLSLASIGTTIWELGELYTGPGRSKYWSGRGCRYKHPYPVGYKATKSHFGNQYTMEILKGEEGQGPVFKVTVNSSKTCFTGATPTAPWTEACKKSKSQGTRVSGPLFYGFSDLITMQLIENMDGYEETSKPEEEKEEEKERLQ